MNEPAEESIPTRRLDDETVQTARGAARNHASPVCRFPSLDPVRGGHTASPWSARPPSGPTHSPAPYVLASPAMQQVLRVTQRIALSDASVLLTGESGTGKEVVSELIHAHSRHAGGPFVKVNCAALPRELIESELFGATRGAYTGAHETRQGLFVQAEQGTLLLDEITEMPLEAQAKFLRVLQDRRFRPLASSHEKELRCRIIASTNRSPEEAIREHQLRLDLFYRLSVVTIHIPPLRERREDIEPLAYRFVARFNGIAGSRIKGFTSAALDRLTSFDWPGNVRQLENEIHRAVLLCEGEFIDLPDLSLPAPAPAEARRPVRLAEAERQTIAEALRICAGNKVAAARLLGVSRQTLYNKVHQYALVPAPRPWDSFVKPPPTSTSWEPA